MATLVDQITSLAAAIGADVKLINTAVAAKYTKPSGGIPNSDLAMPINILQSTDPDPSSAQGSPVGMYFKLDP